MASVVVYHQELVNFSVGLVSQVLQYATRGCKYLTIDVCTCHSAFEFAAELYVAVELE